MTDLADGDDDRSELDLLVWDAPNVDMTLSNVIGGRPTPASRPRFDAVARWLLAAAGDRDVEGTGQHVEQREDEVAFPAQLDELVRGRDRHRSRGAFCKLSITWKTGARLNSRSGANSSTSRSKGTSWCA